jgi:hypothetical protein
MVNGSTTSRGHPRAYYKFGLFDPQDAPYATFRFYYRTWEEIDKLDLRMGQVDVAESDSVFTDRSSARASATNTPIQEHPTGEGPDRYSISAEYFNYRSSPLRGSPPKGSHHNTPHTSPDRGRNRRTTHIPTAARQALYKQMATPVSHPCGPWAPPVPQVPHMPLISTPPTQSNIDGLSYYPFPAEQSYPAPEPEAAVNMSTRRLSISPSPMLRPFIGHGPLPPSPTKASTKTGTQRSHSAGHSEQTPGRKRAETGGMLMNVMANALKRRVTDAAAR